MIDVFAAFVFGHFFWIIGQAASYYVDVKVFGMLF
jgi:orotate phosphoribosyltransferase